MDTSTHDGLIQAVQVLLKEDVSLFNIRHILCMSSVQLNILLSRINRSELRQSRGRPRVRIQKLSKSKQHTVVQLNILGIHYLDIARIIDADVNSIINFLYETTYGICTCIECGNPFVWVSFRSHHKCERCREKTNKLALGAITEI
ncbi:MAG: hypothetical protein A2X93_07905 [Deltaproteobacteria bacterium GWC2_56_8]|nr:MAG: hypothetical protein A2X93_07905 [Deltaproteobacteria bacterium GWC2_56_8]